MIYYYHYNTTFDEYWLNHAKRNPELLITHLASCYDYNYPIYMIFEDKTYWLIYK